MAFLSDTQLAGMRDTLHSSLPELLTVRRFAFVTDDYGNPVRDVPTDTVYPGRLVQRSAEERTQDGDVQTSDWTALLPWDADVQGKDQVVLGTLTFEVIGPPVYAPSPAQATHLRVSLRHVSG